MGFWPYFRDSARNNPNSIVDQLKGDYQVFTRGTVGVALAGRLIKSSIDWRDLIPIIKWSSGAWKGTESIFFL